MELTYRIYESTTKKANVETPTSLPTSSATTTLSSSTTEQSVEDTSSAHNSSKNEWKEVQLRISENGEMCFTGVDDSIILNEQVTKCNSSNSEQKSVVSSPVNDTLEKTCSELEVKVEVVSNPSVEVQSKSVDANKISALKKDVPALKFIGKETTTTTTSIQSTIASIKNNLVAVSTSNTGKPSITSITTTSNNSTSSCVTTVTACSTGNTTINTTSPSMTTNITGTCSGNTTIVNTIKSLNDRQLGTKHKIQNHSEEEPVAKQPKQTILNHSLGIHNLSNNHPLKRHSQIRKSTEGISTSSELKSTNSSSSITSNTTSTTITSSSTSTASSVSTINSVPSSSTFSKQTIINKQINNNNNNATPMRLNTPQKWPPNRTPTTNLPCYAPKTNYNPVINVPKVQASTSVSRMDQKVTVSSQSSSSSSSQQPATILNNKMAVKSKSNNPVGYKTLRDPPKTWNPQISRASLLKSPDPKYGDLKNVRPAKFFKMRNNMPRYLGNPASGVKPLYQVHNSPEKDKSPETLSKPDKTEIKKHSIVKIDPKTLKPISEKAPEVSNLSNQTDLKINTSSVPIFNPLKLQSSPKSERKSPKSPQSPKPKSSSPPSKRDKLNLNYTPPNPFIPNLTSPTLSPNQFLYPPGPPGFPTYDPRIMAAYHSLLYGQRMPYPPSPLPGLSLDLNQRKNFDLPAPTSPKVPALSQQFSPKGQISPKPPSISETNSKPPVMNEPTSPKPPSIQPNSPKLTTPSNNVSASPDQTATQRNPRGNLTKRTGKESGKNEKSLQNAVEKLTQNRVKELIKSEDLLKNSKSQEKVVTTNDVSTNQGQKTTNDTSHNKSENNNKNVTAQQCTDNKKEVTSNSKDNKSNVEMENIENTKSTLNHNDAKQLPVRKDTQLKKDAQSKEKNSNKNVSNNNNTDSVPLVTDAKKK